MGSDFTFKFTAERVVKVPQKRRKVSEKGVNRLEKIRKRIKHNAESAKNLAK
jgi:hypothetical protein